MEACVTNLAEIVMLQLQSDRETLYLEFESED